MLVTGRLGTGDLGMQQQSSGPIGRCLGIGVRTLIFRVLVSDDSETPCRPPGRAGSLTDAEPAKMTTLAGIARIVRTALDLSPWTSLFEADLTTASGYCVALVAADLDPTPIRPAGLAGRQPAGRWSAGGRRRAEPLRGTQGVRGGNQGQVMMHARCGSRSGPDRGRS